MPGNGKISDRGLKVLLFQRIVPHYRVPIFKALTKKYENMIIVYGQPHKRDSLKNAAIEDDGHFHQIRHQYLTPRNRNIFVSGGLLREVWRYRADILILQYNLGNLNLYPLFLWRHIMNCKIILWSFGYDPPTGFDPRTRRKDRVRLCYYQKCDAALFYWQKAKDLIAAYSPRTDHYFVAPNTLDTQELTRIKGEFDVLGVQTIKRELDLDEDYHFVYVGRLLADKQVNILLRAFSVIENRVHNCRLSIIGDGPERHSLQNLRTELGLKRVQFLGEVLDSREVGKWIYVSDAFIMPGRLGLSVVHSFCFGTPVISQKKDYFHGEGVGYIQEGKTGFLVRDNDIGALAETMEMVLTDNSLRHRLKEQAFASALEDCSIGKMMEGFEQAIQYVSRR